MKILIAGGGTGGHLFPGIALAEEVTTRDRKNEVLFVGTQRGLEARIVPAAGFPLETIPSRGLKGMGPWRFILGLLLLPASFFFAWKLLHRHRPDVVVGVGGYSSGPVVLTAWLLRIPTAIQEQNAVPGFTNRVLSRFTRVVFTAFDGMRRFFPAAKVQLVGNPIRRKLMDNYLRSHVAHEGFTILVFGGSQGARSLNTRMLEALDGLLDVKDKLFFVHQTGRTDVERVRQGYVQKGFQAEVVEFIDDMSLAYAKAELVICRAGATTLAELTVCKRASILIPFPYAADNHQEVNAKAMVESGAALMLHEAELTGQKLAEQIRALMEHPERLREMEKRAGLMGRPEAAKEMADVCVQLMVEAWGPRGRSRAPASPVKESKP